MDVGETGYNTDTILIDVIIAASGSMSGLMLIRPGLQVSGKVVEQTCASGRFLKKKSTTNPIQCWQHIAKPQFTIIGGEPGMCIHFETQTASNTSSTSNA